MGSIISTPYFLEAVNIKGSRFDFSLRRADRRLKATDADTISTVVSIYDIGCSKLSASTKLVPQRLMDIRSGGMSCGCHLGLISRAETHHWDWHVDNDRWQVGPATEQAVSLTLPKAPLSRLPRTAGLS